MKQPRQHNIEKGFTLLEVIVSIGIFAVVAVLAVGALVMIQNISRQAQVTRVIVGNLGFMIDDIVRTAQTSKEFTTQEGFAGYSLLNMKDSAGKTTIYKYVLEAPPNFGKIQKSVDGGTSWADISQPTVNIKSPTRFSVSDPSRLRIVLTAQIGGSSKFNDTINIYTSVTKRPSSQ